MSQRGVQAFTLTTISMHWILWTPQHSLEMFNRKQPLLRGCVAPSTLATQGFSRLQPFQTLRDLEYKLCLSHHKRAPEDRTEVRGGGC